MLLQKRSNGIFYFRWVYPPALRKLLGKRELIKSLRTTSKSQALARAGAYYMAVNESTLLLDRLKSGDINQDEYILELYKRYAPPIFESYKKLVDSHEIESFSEILRQKEPNAFMLKEFQKAASNKKREVFPNITIYQILDGWIEFDPRFKPFATLAKFLKLSPDVYQQYLEDVFQLFFYRYVQVSEKLNPALCKPVLPELIAKQNLSPPESSSIATKAKSILFSELFAQFLTHKKSEVNLSDKMQGDYNDYVKTFLVGVGDKPINTITKKQVKEFLQGYQKLPRRNLKAYKGKPIDALWGLVVPEEDRVSTRTMTSAKKFLSGVFRFAVNQDYLTASPVVDLALKTKLEKRRGNFTDLEVRKIFDVLNGDSHIQKNEWQKWAVLFGAYTGARASEIMGLQKQDFKQAEESGIWLVTIRGTKTANALRQFPLSQELVDKGFLDFVGVGHGRVFPSEKSNKAITAFFPRVLKAAGIPKRNDMNLDRSFHSLRHTVVTKARGAGISHVLVQQVVGHEKTSAGITDNYTHAFTPEQLLPVVEAIKY